MAFGVSISFNHGTISTLNLLLLFRLSILSFIYFVALSDLQCLFPSRRSTPAVCLETGGGAVDEPDLEHRPGSYKVGRDLNGSMNTMRTINSNTSPPIPKRPRNCDIIHTLKELGEDKTVKNHGYYLCSRTETSDTCTIRSRGWFETEAKDQSRQHAR